MGEFPYSRAATEETAMASILGHLASAYGKKPIKVRQPYAMGALMDIAEYVALVSGVRDDGGRLRYVRAMSRLQASGQIKAEEVGESWPVGSLTALVYPHVLVTLTHEAYESALK